MQPRLHPRNRDFAWSAAHPAPRRLSAQQRREWEENGCFLLRGAFGPGEIAELVAEIDPLEEQARAFLRTRPGGKLFIAEEGNITFRTHLVLLSQRLRRFCGNPVFQDLGHDLIGPDVRLYWDQAVYKYPQKPRPFPWHQDNGYTYVEPQQYLTCWVALSDATVENGCPWVAPGLHRRGTLEHRMTDLGWECLQAPEGAIPVEAPAGSIVVFSSLTPHHTGPNTSDTVRKAYIVQFAPDGALVLRDGAAPEPQNAADRQYPILVGGRPVAPSPGAAADPPR